MVLEIETTRPTLTLKDMKGHADPDWCPGCGDFGVLHALKQAIVDLGLQPHEVLTISGIGCSSNLRLHQHLRHAHLAWSGACGGDWRAAGQSLLESGCHRWRRRW